MALSNADRQKRYRERRKQEGKSPRWVQKGPKLLTAGDVARQRFEALVAEKLHDAFDDTTMWEFYTFLYKKAQEHLGGYTERPLRLAPAPGKTLQRGGITGRSGVFSGFIVVCYPYGVLRRFWAFLFGLLKLVYLCKV